MTDSLRSHSVSPKNMAETVAEAQARIIAAGDKEHVSVAQQLGILKQLTAFDLGRFLLQHRGVDGYWTHYFLTHPWFGRKTGKNNKGQDFSEYEDFILDKSPLFLATQQRFEIFLQENQKAVKEGAVLACVPSGLLGELLYLNFSDINSIKLVGLDFDKHALTEARLLAEKQGLSQFIDLRQGDAWQMNIENEFDLLSSNGLNIYEPDSEKVIALYQQFYNALKPGGKLVTSFLTHTPVSGGECEWLMDKLNPADALLQRIIFSDVIGTKWQCYCSTAETKAQLESVGFRDVHFIYDQARIFPTVVAIK